LSGPLSVEKSSPGRTGSVASKEKRRNVKEKEGDRGEMRASFLCGRQKQEAVPATSFRWGREKKAWVLS